MLLPNVASASFSFFGLLSNNANAAVGAARADSPTAVLTAATNYDPNPNKGLGDVQTISDNALVAHSGPAGTIADVASSTPPDRISVYVVRPGDTLSDIANMHRVSVNTIIWANDLKNARDVHPGDTLIILPVSGIEHTVVKGDTFKSLAKKFSADAEEIAQFNGLDFDKPLAVGTKIIIPGGEIAVTPSTTSGNTAPQTYSGSSGSALPGYYSNPVIGGHMNQGLHGKNGVDIGLAPGAPIHAAAEGTVIVARGGGWNSGYGNYVVISHPNGTQTLYAHMRNIIVSVGESVSDSQVVGYMGTTGNSTGNHLHFEVRGAANPFRNCAMRAITNACMQ